VYAIAAPLALALGYLVSSPESKTTYEAIGLLLFFFALPFFLKWHHALMIFFWNSAFVSFFLPGSPDIWVAFAGLSFGISFLNHIIFQKKFLRAPELTLPLLFLGAVVLGTAWYRGGIGIRALGGASYGGRYYIYILVAIMGYFAFTAEPIPIAKSGKMAGLFFLSGISYILGNIAYTLGPVFYFLYYFVSSSTVGMQAASAQGREDIDRIQGLAPACTAVLCFLLARYGIRGLFDWAKPWRFIFLCITVGAACFAGFRSAMLMLCLIFAFQFYFEGLLRTHFLPIVAGLALFGLLPIVFFPDKMPLSVQRAISFLPVKVDTEIMESAKGSSEWRLEMWAVVWKEVPKYLIIGKGYGIDPTELFLVNEAQRLGIATSGFEGFLLAGDYHSGPLSVIMPFGIPGVIAFLWVLFAGFRVLYLNYRFGDTRLRRINCTLMAWYLAYCLAFMFIFGAFNSQLFIFLGICGFSVSLNGGVKRRVKRVQKPFPMPQTALAMDHG
jgi:hypothetical protein